jgi:hypothetical protein
MKIGVLSRSKERGFKAGELQNRMAHREGGGKGGGEEERAAVEEEAEAAEVNS